VEEEIERMNLCSNRPEGFGPHSNISSPLPTTCFTDVILLPLPTWLALLFLPILFALSIHHRKLNFDPSTLHIRHQGTRNCLYIITASVYYILIVCNILMLTLEIVRLELIHFGIGLLPFSYVGLLLGGGLHWSKGVQGRVRGWHAVNLVVWIGGVVMSVIQVVGLSNEGINGRKGSKYPISDQVIDAAVMAGVYAVLGILETVIAFWRALNRIRAIREERGDSEAIPVVDRLPVDEVWNSEQGKWNGN